MQFGLPPKRSWAPIPDDPPTGPADVNVIMVWWFSEHGENCLYLELCRCAISARGRLLRISRP